MTGTEYVAAVLTQQIIPFRFWMRKERETNFVAHSTAERERSEERRRGNVIVDRLRVLMLALEEGPLLTTQLCDRLRWPMKRVNMIVVAAIRENLVRVETVYERGPHRSRDMRTVIRLVGIDWSNWYALSETFQCRISKD